MSDPTPSSTIATAADGLSAEATKKLEALVTQSTLSEEDFQLHYAALMKEMQRAGECRYEWVPVRHLLALRLQSVSCMQVGMQVYESFVARDSAASSSLDWLCANCRAIVSRQGAQADIPHCRRTEVDEEPKEKRYRRMMHLLIGFYKPPFTFQRMCDLLLEPTRFCKNTNKFLLAFSKLVCGISCDNTDGSAFDSLEWNWSESKDATLGVPQMRFTTREEDEFQNLDVGPNGAIATHAVLPPQYHRIGLTLQEMRGDAEFEVQARLALQQRQAQEATGTSVTEEAAAAAAAGSSSTPSVSGASSGSDTTAATSATSSSSSTAPTSTNSNGHAPMETSD